MPRTAPARAGATYNTYVAPPVYGGFGGGYGYGGGIGMFPGLIFGGGGEIYNIAPHLL